MYKNGWEKPGRARLLDDDEVISIKNDLNKCSGETIYTTRIRELITLIQQDKVTSMIRVLITKYD